MSSASGCHPEDYGVKNYKYLMKTPKLRKLSADQTRTERIEILVTPPERNLIEEAVAKSKVSLSHLVRQSALLMAQALVAPRSEVEKPKMLLGRDEYNRE